MMTGPSQKDFSLLGVGRDCSVAQLKSAFRAKAKECHPDLGGARAGDQAFYRLRESYERILEELSTDSSRDGLPRPAPWPPEPERRRQPKRPSAEKEAPSSSAKTASASSAKARKLYKEGIEAWEAFERINRGHALELKVLHRLARGSIAMVDLMKFLRLLSDMDRSASAAIERLKQALEKDAAADWAPDAREKLESLERQRSGLARIRAGLE